MNEIEFRRAHALGLHHLHGQRAHLARDFRNFALRHVHIRQLRLIIGCTINYLDDSTSNFIYQRFVL